MNFRAGIPVELPEPNSGSYPDDELGEKQFGLGGLPDHVDGLMFKVLEGLALRCLCDVCGGRREQLIVYGEAIPDGADGTNKALQQRLQDEVLGGVQNWANDHEPCPDQPFSYQLPDRLEQHTREIEERGREHLAETGILPAQVFLLLSDGRELVLPFLLDLPDRSEDFEAHIAELERRKAAVREHLREQDVRIRAATLFGQADSDRPEEDPVALPDAEETVMCQQVAPPFGRSGLAPLERSDFDEAPRATLGSFRWSGHTGPQPMLDGLVATEDGRGWEAIRPRRAADARGG